MNDIKVCKECWADIDCEYVKKHTFKLSDYVCSEYCLQQWIINELEACNNEQ